LRLEYLVKTFVEEAKQSLGDSTFERAVKMKIENLKVPFGKVSEHEIVPLEDRSPFAKLFWQPGDIVF
jgi:hypothetical protein